MNCWQTDTEANGRNDTQEMGLFQVAKLRGPIETDVHTTGTGLSEDVPHGDVHQQGMTSDATPIPTAAAATIVASASATTTAPLQASAETVLNDGCTGRQQISDASPTSNQIIFLTRWMILRRRRKICHTLLQSWSTYGRRCVQHGPKCPCWTLHGSPSVWPG